MDVGYIKLWRSMLNWEWHDDPNTLSVYIHLILSANIEEAMWHGITVKRGDVVSSYAKICSQTGLNLRQARTAIKHLETTGEVTRSSYSKFTVFTLINYDKFQTSTSKTTSDRQGIDKQNDKQPTSNRQQYKNIKEKNKKEKNKKENGGTPALEERSTAGGDEVARAIRERDF